MTELKKNNKRTVETSDKKPSVKKFKPSLPSDKSSKDGKPKFDPKKSGKFNSKPGGKFNGKPGGKFGKGKPAGKFNGKPEQQKPLEKTNWNELKQKKKDLKIQRKKNKTKDLYDVDVKAKKVYEELKQ
jgi:hypothetical protein